MFRTNHGMAIAFYNCCTNCERRRVPIDPEFATGTKNRLQNFCKHISDHFQIDEKILGQYSFRLTDPDLGLVRENITLISPRNNVATPSSNNTRGVTARQNASERCPDRPAATMPSLAVRLTGSMDPRVHTFEFLRAFMITQNKNGAPISSNPPNGAPARPRARPATRLETLQEESRRMIMLAETNDELLYKQLVNVTKMLSKDPEVSRAAILDGFDCVCKVCDLCKYRDDPTFVFPDK